LRVITLDRPDKRNALTRALVQQLTDELRRVDADSKVRGVVLAGAGPSFSAGVDLHEFADGTPDSVRLLIEALRELCATLRGMGKPVACAIQGHCLGGALELAACCDFRVCAPNAQLGMPEVFLGIPSVIDAVMLGHLVGTGRAAELLLTGDSISGETAYQWGLANRLAPPEDLVQVACGVLSLVTRHAPEVIAAQKRLHQEWLDLPYEQAVARSVDPLVDAIATGRPQHIAGDRLRKR
jgi:enoyl-CoA hydratase/carnithine racemase